jgi:DNA invertase Pin-like site-specific DNA recombinase
MSTEHQKYSIEYQQIAIGAYASQHNFRIVRSYIDSGRSGLRIERRDALRQLIDDVEHGRANFRTILVYDVSRWGRFQDFDESAYYEFICKHAGVPVQYCAEQFDNDGTLVAQLIKNLKRAMAGEYSRELSIKVYEGHRRGFSKGCHQGGTAPYGFRRLLLDEFGVPRGILKPGERKHFKTDRIILTLGPRSERNTVSRIFRLFVISRMPRKHIAKLLNKEGKPNSVGNPWTDNEVLRVLTNEKYVGNLVYGRTAKKLLGPVEYMPPKSWLRINGALEPIVDAQLFAAAQRILANPWWSFTDNQLLDTLTAALCKYGYLSSRVLSSSRFAPAAVTYRERFGSLTNAYRLIGYKPTQGYPHCKPEILPSLHREVIWRLISSVERNGGKVQYDEKSKTLRLNDDARVAVVIIPYQEPRTDVAGWTVRFYFFPQCELIVAGRMDKTNKRILDYYLIPRKTYHRTVLRITESNLSKFRKFKLRSFPAFYKSAQRLVQ